MVIPPVVRAEATLEAVSLLESFVLGFSSAPDAWGTFRYIRSATKCRCLVRVRFGGVSTSYNFVHSRRAHLFLITVALIWGCGPNKFKDIVLKPTPKVIDRRFFGMHIHRSVDGTRWPPVPFGSWRLWDAHVTWADIEPGPQAWNWTRLDAYVAMAQAHDVEILLTLGMTPPWASSEPNRHADPPLGYPQGAQAPPARLEDWTEYVRTVALRYKGRIRYYEIWNEPNQMAFFSGSPQQMAELSKAAYGVIKAI